MKIRTQKSRRLYTVESKIHHQSSHFRGEIKNPVFTRETFQPEEFLTSKELKIWNQLSPRKQEKILEKAQKVVEEKIHSGVIITESTDTPYPMGKQTVSAPVQEEPKAATFYNLTPGQRLRVRRNMEHQGNLSVQVQEPVTGGPLVEREKKYDQITKKEQDTIKDQLENRNGRKGLYGIKPLEVQQNVSEIEALENVNLLEEGPIPKETKAFNSKSDIEEAVLKKELNKQSLSDLRKIFPGKTKAEDSQERSRGLGSASQTNRKPQEGSEECESRQNGEGFEKGLKGQIERLQVGIPYIKNTREEGQKENPADPFYEENEQALFLEAGCEDKKNPDEAVEKIKERIHKEEKKGRLKDYARITYEVRRAVNRINEETDNVTQSREEKEVIAETKRQLLEEGRVAGSFGYRRTKRLSSKATRAAQNVVQKKIGVPLDQVRRAAAKMAEARKRARGIEKGVRLAGQGALYVIQAVLLMLQALLMSLLPMVMPLIIIIALVLGLLLILTTIISAIASFFAATPLRLSGIMPYYNQYTYRDVAFNGNTISSDGCGITSFAMVASYLTGTSILPPEIAALADANGKYLYNTVNSHGAIANLAEKYELGEVEEMGGPHQNCCGRKAFDLEYLKEKLEQNCPLIASHTGGYFATEGHYVAYCGVGPNGVYVYDPGSSYKYNESIRIGGTDWETAFYGAKHIWIFEPGPDPEPLEGATNAEKIFNYCVNHNFSPEASAAIVGTMWGETSQGLNDIQIDATEIGNNNEGIGICQWSYDRKPVFLNYAESRGEPWPTTSLEVQLDFFYLEITTNNWLWVESGYGPQYGADCHISLDEFRQLTDIDHAVRAFCANFERGPRREKGLQFRINKAREVYAAYN